MGGGGSGGFCSLAGSWTLKGSALTAVTRVHFSHGTLHTLHSANPNVSLKHTTLTTRLCNPVLYASPLAPSFQTTSDYLGQRAQREALGQQRVAHAARLRHRARLVAVHADAVGAQSQLRPRVERPDGQPRRQPQRVLRRLLCIVDDRARQRARREVPVGGVRTVGEDLGGGGQPAALRRAQQLRARLHAAGESG